MSLFLQLGMPLATYLGEACDKASIKEPYMKKAILAIGAIALAFPVGGWASPWNKKTNLEVKETILIPGKQLPPGKYVMKLADSDSNRHIVQIFNEDESKVEATILAIPNSRMEPKGDTELTYWETPAGVPPALKAWFYPGDSFGQEFAYPKKVAEQLSATNSTKVPWYEGKETAEYDISGLRDTEVHDFDQSAAPEAEKEAPTVAENSNQPNEPAPEVAAAPPSTTEQGRDQPAVTPAEPEPQTVAEAPREPAATDLEQDPAPAQDEQLLAQNRAQEPPPATERTPETLPQTATPYGAVLMAGLGLMALGGMLAAFRLS
jgi:hypothetical protein